MIKKGKSHFKYLLGLAYSLQNKVEEELQLQVDEREIEIHLFLQKWHKYHR